MSKNNILLSIIIPSYNVEKYLRKCLDSCLMNQSDSNEQYEVIIINDGSLDKTLHIAQEYLYRYSNIHLVDQENRGLSVSRNIGIDLAKGKFVWFVDSDDFLETNCLSEILSVLQRNLLIDIAHIQYQVIYDDTDKTVLVDYPCFTGTLSGRECLLSNLYLIPAQFSIYRKEFLLSHKLYFEPYIYHEDCEFKPKAIFFAEKCICIKKVCYNYLQRTSGSITSKFRLKNLKDLLYVNGCLANFASANNVDLSLIRTFNKIISVNVNSILNSFFQIPEQDKNQALSFLISERLSYWAMIKSGKLLYIIEGILLLLSPRLTLFIYNLLKH